MKKDIEWVISEIDQRVENVEEHEKTTDYNKGVARGFGISLFLIDQLDEPEKVIIPQFVADWIEHCKENNLDLYEAFGHSDMSVEVSDFIGDMDADEFARAWLDYPNIEVEKEKLYYVIDKSRKPILTIYKGKVIASVSVSKVERAEKLSTPYFKYRLTEKQIKDYDERYWLFAVEVAE